MTYSIHGLDPAQFAALFAMTDAELAAIRATRTFATASMGFPCRVSLEDAREGDELILLHYTSHAVDTPYRSAYAIFVRAAAKHAASETMPTSRLSRLSTGNRRTCSSPMFSATWAVSSSS